MLVCVTGCLVSMFYMANVRILNGNRGMHNYFVMSFTRVCMTPSNFPCPLANIFI